MAKRNGLPQMHLLCSEDKLRVALTGVYIDGKHAVASDAHVLGVVDITDFFDEEKLAKMNGKIIPGAVWKKMGEDVINTAMIEVYETGVSWPLFEPKGHVHYEFLDEKFPDYKQFIPTSNFEDVEKIGLNIKVAARLLKALDVDNNQAELIITSSNKAMIIQSKNLKGFGIIMPVMIAETRQDVIQQIRMNFL